MSDEKRAATRVLRGTLNFFPLILDSGDKLLFGVENISSTGLLIRILDPEVTVLPAPGTQAVFADCPEELRRAFREIREVIISDLPTSLRRALADRQGTVVWREDLFCGVRFNPPLDLSTEDLRQIMEEILPEREPLPFEEFGGLNDPMGDVHDPGL